MCRYEHTHIYVYKTFALQKRQATEDELKRLRVNTIFVYIYIYICTHVCRYELMYIQIYIDRYKESAAQERQMVKDEPRSQMVIIIFV